MMIWISCRRPSEAEHQPLARFPPAVETSVQNLYIIPASQSQPISNQPIPPRCLTDRIFHPRTHDFRETVKVAQRLHDK